MVSFISKLKKILSFQNSERKYWDNKYEEWDEEGKSFLKIFCNPVLELIENENLDVRGLRYYFYQIQSYKWYRCSKEIQEKHRNTLSKMWAYAKKKGFVDKNIDFETFCSSSIAIFNMEGY